ncbi:MAG TPA: hypothetical protein VIK82_11670 [Porticoccaceae bacterium]
MNKASISKTLAASLLVAGLAPAYSVLAEPRSFDDLSFRQERPAVEQGEVTRIVYPIGHGKYRHHQTPLAVEDVDTEIAVFEEVEEERFTRPQRSDRIPR